MKFGKITSKTVSSNAVSFGGAIAGGALSGGIVTLVPDEQKIYARGGIAAAGLLGAAAVKGTSSSDNLVKFLLVGMAIRQGTEMIKEFAEKEMQPVDESTTTANKFVAGMVGLACPDCDNHVRALNAAPVINFDDISSERPTPRIAALYSEAPQREVSGMF
ncbi:hypothetical protein RM549_06185 [Salegentibacter sp. F188]|uniref:Uncharacterized protein n=1 Tax=Autumnicola patrickiae TaxID=3075591 RepID=A0ABU3E058_9FLAO|nr:hypothetical protein [Salegentibacter sp. F188]MDT0689366.1 hypothetical protein [Salegentibacter sp. F188]